MSSSIPSKGSISCVVRQPDFDVAFYGNNVTEFSEGEYMQLVVRTAEPIRISDIIDTQYSTKFLEELADAVLPKPVPKGGMSRGGSFGFGMVEAGIVGNWAIVCGPASQVADSIRLFAGLGVPIPRVNTAQVRALGVEGVSAIIAVPVPGTEETGYKPFGFRYKPASQEFIDIPGSLESHDGGVPRWGERVDRTLRCLIGSSKIKNGVRVDYLSDASEEIEQLLDVPFVGVRFSRGQNGMIRFRYEDVIRAKGERGNWEISYQMAPEYEYMTA